VAAEPSRVKVRRHRLHVKGDHTECRREHCPKAGTVERNDVRDLRSAVEAEFAADPVRLETGRALVELAGGRGQPAVSALVALDRMVEASRAGRATPPYTGPVTIDDEVREMVDKLAEASRREGFEEGLAEGRRVSS
jgi:hypothetical protein